MSVTRIRLARTGRAERHVVQALRAGVHGTPGNAGASDEAGRLLHALARQAHAIGYEILPVGAAYLGKDEARLLGWLAYFQREERETLLVDGALIAPLKQAATALRADQRLPYQVLLWANRFTPAEERSPPPARFQQVGRTTVRSRAIAHTQAHGRVSAQALRSIGLSHQYLSQLCLKGALVRVGHGFYEAPPNKI